MRHLPEPTTPFVSAPFFGEYASTARPAAATDPLAKQDQTDTGTKKDKKKTDKKGTKAYPPSQYESPPQPAPKPGGGGNQQQSTPVAPTGGVGVG